MTGRQKAALTTGVVLTGLMLIPMVVDRQGPVTATSSTTLASTPTPTPTTTTITPSAPLAPPLPGVDDVSSLSLASDSTPPPPAPPAPAPRPLATPPRRIKLIWHFSNRMDLGVDGKMRSYSWADALPGDRATFELYVGGKRSKTLRFNLPARIPTRPADSLKSSIDGDLKVVTIIPFDSAPIGEKGARATLKRSNWNLGGSPPVWARELRAADLDVANAFDHEEEGEGVRLYDPKLDGKKELK